MMKKLAVMMVLVLTSSLSILAQDDMKINYGVRVVNDNILNEEDEKSLVMAMQKLIASDQTQFWDYSPLVLACVPSIHGINSSLGDNPEVQVDLKLDFVVADLLSDEVCSSDKVILQAVGATQEEAVSKALKNIDQHVELIGSMVMGSMMTIVENYNNRCEEMLQRAMMYKEMNEPFLAMAYLNSVPPMCEECKQRAFEEVSMVYNEASSQYCEEMFEIAKILSQNKQKDDAKANIKKMAYVPGCEEALGNLEEIAKKSGIKVEEVTNGVKPVVLNNESAAKRKDQIELLLQKAKEPVEMSPELLELQNQTILNAVPKD